MVMLLLMEYQAFDRPSLNQKWHMFEIKNPPFVPKYLNCRALQCFRAFSVYLLLWVTNYNSQIHQKL